MNPLVKSLAAGAFACWMALLPAASSAQTTPDDEDERSLTVALQQALWPADIAVLAERCRQRFPQSAEAADALALRDAGRRTAALIREHDVRLFRAAFEPVDSAEVAAVAQRNDLRRAALGDAEAAWRMAQLFGPDHLRHRGWLQLAAYLGHARAAYELALHFRRNQQPMLAAAHEAQAQALGYGTPRELDHRRK